MYGMCSALTWTCNMMILACCRSIYSRSCLLGFKSGPGTSAKQLSLAMQAALCKLAASPCNTVIHHPPSEQGCLAREGLPPTHTLARVPQKLREIIIIIIVVIIIVISIISHPPRQASSSASCCCVNHYAEPSNIYVHQLNHDATCTTSRVLAFVHSSWLHCEW